jgi:hypothetical protein
VEAPIVRRLFSSSPQDPRYHMLTVLSEKFNTENSEDLSHEPRAALFLNRFTRTATVMYATSGIEEIIGISSEDLKGSSFYFCIAENCLEDAIKCLETAKGNDSIAYLRFWFRDPRQNEPPATSDEEMTDASVSGDDVREGTTTEDSSPELSRQSINSGTESASSESAGRSGSSSHPLADTILQGASPNLPEATSPPVNSFTSSGESINPSHASAAIFEQPEHGRPNSAALSSAPTTPTTPAITPFDGPIELEAVVSCTSDGLVVCLRRARPLMPSLPTTPPQQGGIFAAPWAPEPIFFPPIQVEGFLGEPTNGPSKAAFLNSIREVGAFAWALTGINGCLADYARGTPMHKAQPAGGFPVYDPTAPPDPDSGNASLASLDDETSVKRDGADGADLPAEHSHQHYHAPTEPSHQQHSGLAEPIHHQYNAPAEPSQQYHDGPNSISHQHGGPTDTGNQNF